MKQYRVIKCAVGQLQEELNSKAADGWLLNHFASVDKENMVVVLEKPTTPEKEELQNVSQQQARLFQTVTDIMQSQHDLVKSIVQNIRV
jgi:hypothetical protein